MSEVMLRMIKHGWKIFIAQNFVWAFMPPGVSFGGVNVVQYYFQPGEKDTEDALRDALLDFEKIVSEPAV